MVIFSFSYLGLVGKKKLERKLDLLPEYKISYYLDKISSKNEDKSLLIKKVQNGKKLYHMMLKFQ
ncbi:hypothetical protein NWP96_03330 [Mycoplasmopsis cynos]|nr:hypothetical protein [Mycoplasmopsis cynos]